MSKKYDFWANKKTIPNLKLYTILTGVWFGTLGINFLIVFFYWKYVLNYEFANLVLILSIIMFLLVPIAITDPKKESRDLLATVSYGILHTVCTLASIIISRCWYLVGIYILELFVVLIILLKSIRRKSKRFQELLTSVF